MTAYETTTEKKYVDNSSRGSNINNENSSSYKFLVVQYLSSVNISRKKLSYETEYKRQIDISSELTVKAYKSLRTQTVHLETGNVEF